MTTQDTTATPAAVSPALANALDRLASDVDVRVSGHRFDAELCMNCGICTASCPLGLAVLPRQLMRFGVLGLAGLVRAQSDAVFSCLLCGACEENCPAGVHITGNVRLLRRWLLEEGES